MDRERLQPLSHEEAAVVCSRAAVMDSCAILISNPRLENCPIVYASSAFEELTGLSTADLCGKSLQSIVLEQPEFSLKQSLDDVLLNAAKHRTMLKLARRGNSPISAELQILPVCEGSKQPSHVVYLFQDFSDHEKLRAAEGVQHKLEEQLHELESSSSKRMSRLKAINKQLSDEVRECRRIEQVQRDRSRYLNRMHRVVQAIAKTPEPESWLANCVAVMRDVFQADRAWLLYPCDPYAQKCDMPVEDAAPEYPRMYSKGKGIAIDGAIRAMMSQALVSQTPVVQRHVDDEVLSQQLAVRSQMYIAIRPRVGKPWLLGLHQCRYELEWVEEDQRLFTEISERIEELLASVVLHKQLKEREELLTRLLESTEEGIYGIDIDGRCTFANNACATQLGYDVADDLVGKNMRQLTGFNCPGDLNSGSASCHACQVHRTGEGLCWDGGYFLHRDGSHFPVEFRCNPINKNDSQQGATVTFIDISERKKYQEEIWHQANYDALTGLPIRSLVVDRLEQAIHAANRDQHSVALLYVDLDRFKWVNDTLGHEAGDKLLIETARRLKACARESDTVARIGGDEFCVVLPNTQHSHSAKHVAQKIISVLNKPFELLENDSSLISASVGIALYPDDADTLNSLLKYADMAMYRAKNSGRNRYAFFTEEMNREAQLNAKTERELHHALENNELELYYQPLVQLESGKIVGAEALIRWHHPERGLLYPKDFIPLAEETGLILAIGDWVLKNVIKQLEEWRSQNVLLVRTSINISARQCSNKSFVSHLMDVLSCSHVSPNQLGLAMDITEGVMLEHVDETVELLQSVRDMGIGLTVDDFGTGYTSLIELKRFPVEAIKIARPFIQSITSNPKDAGVTHAIIDMSHQLGMSVIAEGIETEEQLRFLKEAGCDLGYGHFYYKPVPADEFKHYFEEAC